MREVVSKFGTPENTRLMRSHLAASAHMPPANLGIRRLFQDVRDAVIVADAGFGRIVLWNPAAETVFGYTAQEAIGMPTEVLVPHSLQPRHRAGLAHCNATGHCAIIDGRRVVEVPAMHKSGEEVVIELSLSPIEDATVGGRAARRWRLYYEWSTESLHRPGSWMPILVIWPGFVQATLRA